jgi:hypothetical protein
MSRAFLLVKAPACSFLGEGRKALVLGAQVAEHDFEVDGNVLHGLHAPLHVGLARDACEFEVDGDLESAGAKLTLRSDSRMWLENDHSRFEADVPLHAWGCVEHSEWCKSYVLNSNGTLSPTPAPHLVLGFERDGSIAKVCLVGADDEARRLHFGSPKDDSALHDQLRADAEARRALKCATAAQALALLTPEVREQLRDDGFTVLPGGVPPALVRSARAEINRLLGEGPLNQGTKAAAFASHPSIVALGRDSTIPVVLAELLGGSADYYRERFRDAQVALRFPGDNSPPGIELGDIDAHSSHIARAHFEEVRKAWHIDGLADPHLADVSDHYGTIHNFSALVGILLSDLERPMAGELCAYPGSHTALSQLFSTDAAALNTVREGGTAKLPVGEQTDTLLPQPVRSVLGKAGDVIIANYMTAHLIAPNLSSEIRYCVYFRVHGQGFEESRQRGPGTIANKASMLDPWCHWPGIPSARKA